MMKFNALMAAHFGVFFNALALGETEGWFSSSMLGGLTAYDFFLAGTIAFVLTFAIETSLFGSSDILQLRQHDELFLPGPSFVGVMASAAHWQEASDRITKALPLLSAKMPCAYCGTTKGYGEFNTCLSCGAPKP
jgi:hypothetical protein